MVSIRSWLYQITGPTSSMPKRVVPSNVRPSSICSETFASKFGLSHSLKHHALFLVSSTIGELCSRKDPWYDTMVFIAAKCVFLKMACDGTQSTTQFSKWSRTSTWDFCVQARLCLYTRVIRLKRFWPKLSSKWSSVKSAWASRSLRLGLVVGTVIFSSFVALLICSMIVSL